MTGTGRNSSSWKNPVDSIRKRSKTVNGSIKQIRSMIAMLKCMANSHLNVSFATMLKTKVFGLNWSLYSDTIDHVHLALRNRDIAIHLYKALI